MSVLDDIPWYTDTAAATTAKATGSSTVAGIITSVGGAAASVINAVRGGSPAPATPVSPMASPMLLLIGGAVAGAAFAKNRLLGAAAGAAAGFVVARMF